MLLPGASEGSGMNQDGRTLLQVSSVLGKTMAITLNEF